MKSNQHNAWLDAQAASQVLYEAADGKVDDCQILDILEKAKALQGLTLEEVAVLCQIDSTGQSEALFETAREVKEQIYGRRMVLFAPLYISNLCGNDCTYCAFRSSNKTFDRTVLDREAIGRETEELVRQGHKRILLVSGESYPGNKGGFNYILDSIAAVYDVAEAHGNIRRVNVNLAPLSIEQFGLLKQAGIGTYQLFQETYHRDTYAAVHIAGKKRDFDWRCSAMDRAMQAGIDDVGMGVLFGLFDWRFELVSLMQHIRHLEQTHGVGCHTISVPRIEPAYGSEVSLSPPEAVSDFDFKKLIAILRLAVPYTGLILSTRESASMRHECYSLGISQISAGSRTNPGGYSQDGNSAGQFQLGDHRSLDEVIHELSAMNFIPSFCTACYRLGRTGKDFMDLARPGLIRLKCDPNAVTTFQEYLIDFASEEVRTDGEKAITGLLKLMQEKPRRHAERMLEKIRSGKRDVFC